MRDVTHSHVWHHSSIPSQAVLWIDCICDSHVTWLIYTCFLTHTHSHAWRDSFTCVTWLIHTKPGRLMNWLQHTSVEFCAHHLYKFSKVSSLLSKPTRKTIKLTFEKIWYLAIKFCAHHLYEFSKVSSILNESYQKTIKLTLRTTCIKFPESAR